MSWRDRRNSRRYDRTLSRIAELMVQLDSIEKAAAFGSWGHREQRALERVKMNLQLRVTLALLVLARLDDEVV